MKKNSEPMFLRYLGIGFGILYSVAGHAQIADSTLLIAERHRNPVVILTPVTPGVWGFADLHSHPASHLAFGSDANGNNGLFWGKPADPDNLSNFTVATDLPPCSFLTSAVTHNGGTSDPVQLASDNQIVGNIDQTVALPFQHQSTGGPGFQSWPSAVSVDHQQMDITSLKRAYDGGLRLLFASVTDDEILSDLWNQKIGTPMPVHDTNFDYNSARKQLSYITRLVQANSSWMEIVSSPAQARAVVSGNKLAVVLSLEMDGLSITQVLSLVQNYNVRHVIPIHLVDNSFGGTAVYNDKFNSENAFLNDGNYYSIAKDPNVNFNLGVPQVLTSTLSQLPIFGSLLQGLYQDVSSIPGLSSILSSGSPTGWLPTNISSDAFNALNYGSTLKSDGTASAAVPGDINARGLNPQQFLQLMTARCGSQPCNLLLDIVHMGQNSADQALTLAEQFQYPLMDSHTGIRCNSETGCQTAYGAVYSAANASASTVVNERSLPVNQLLRIRNLHGVIGLGLTAGGESGGPVDPDPVGTWITNYSIALSLMGGKGVALGSDANGLSPLIPYDGIPTNYPLTVASEFGAPPGTPALQPFQLGNKTFDFEKDGIATYGLLPDFIQAASQSRTPLAATFDQKCVDSCKKIYATCLKFYKPADYPRGTPSPCRDCSGACPFTGGGFDQTKRPLQQITALFHTAEDAIEMWEAVEKAVVVETVLPSGTIGMHYSQQLAASGGTPPYTWTIANPSDLPPGLSLGNGNMIQGWPTQLGVYTFNVSVHDNAQPPGLTVNVPVSVTINSVTCPAGYSYQKCPVGNTCVRNGSPCPNSDVCPVGQVIQLCGTPPRKTCMPIGAKCPVEQGGNPK